MLDAGPARAVESAPSGNDNHLWLFTSFRDNGEQGLQFLYSEDGLDWQEIPGVFLKPQAGAGKLMRDPSIARGPGGVYHLVWTSAWRGDLGFGYASSPDLVNWSPQRFIPAMQHEPDAVNVWAPELFYDEKNSHFIICWAATIPGRFPDHGEPHDNNQRMYCTTTRDFTSFTPTRLFLEPGFSVIDATIVRDDSRYVLVLKENSRACMKLRVAFGDSPLGPWSNISEPFTGMFTEGPSVAKLGDQWYIYYDAYRQGRYGAARTRDFIELSDASAEVSFPPGHKHGTVLSVPRDHVQRLLAAAQGTPPPADAPPAAESAEAAYTRTITERAEKIVAGLKLSDAAAASRVRDALIAQYRRLREIHADRDARLANLPADGDVRKSVESDIAMKLDAAHRRFLAVLSTALTPAQVDEVKDALTYGVVPGTYRRYQQLLPELSDEERAEVLAHLLEAREYAMDAGSSDEKHAWFGKYKGRINNYLSAAGYDLKAAENALAEREKSRRDSP